jgi:hypothetical protein
VSKKKEKEDIELVYWTNQLILLESGNQCQHPFSISFTLDQKIDYCKRMLANIDLKKSL